MPARWSAYALAASMLACVAHVHAQGAETWRAGATEVTVAVQSWGPDCGPAPRASRSSGGGTVSVRREGDALIIQVPGRTIRSDKCWSENPAIRRGAMSFRADTWSLRCATPKDDPREESGNYSLQLIDNDKLRYRDVSRYNWKLRASTCAAMVTTTQMLSRIGPATAATARTPATSSAAPTAATAAAKPAASAAATTTAGGCVPGKPAKLTLRPTQAQIELGERVCVKPRATDANDCVIEAPKVRWSLDHAAGVRARLDGGCLRAGEHAAEAEGTFRVVATLGALRAVSTVRVVAPDMSGLVARRLEVTPTAAKPAADRADDEQATAAQPDVQAGDVQAGEEPPPHGDAAVAAAARPSGPPEPQPSAEPAPEPEPAAPSRVSAPSSPTTTGGGQGDGVWGVALIVVLLGAVAGLLFWLRRRSSAQRVRTAIRESSIPAAAQASGQASVPAPAEAQWICPTCRVGFPASRLRCPTDGTPLEPYEQFSRKARERPAKMRRCPTCGERFPSPAQFCGTDGAALIEE